MSNEFAAIFQEEAKELLENLEQDLLDLEESPESSDLVDRVFRTMHTIKGSGAMFGFTNVADFTHHVETVLAEVRAGHLAVSHELISLILQSRDHITSLIIDSEPDTDKGSLIIEKLAQLLSDSSDAAGEQSVVSEQDIERPEDFEQENKESLPIRIGEILVEKGHVAEAALADVIVQQKPLGEMLVDADVATQDNVDEALEEQKKRKASQAKKTGQIITAKTDSIRVAVEKLDVLINLVGELLVTQARLSESSGAYSNQDLLESIEDVERLTTELRECALSMRMLPIGSTFARFKRLVRDLSSDLGKEVQLLTFGAETELDKTMLGMLAEPLVHLIRNAVDHGIETPAEREAMGKPVFGTISLSAVYSGPNVVVTVSDDGRGIDGKALRAKGILQGLVSSSSVSTDKEVLDLIFHPGMSTSAKISEVSGRGVGMDVVYSSIRKLKGSVAVSSPPETGTTLTLTLPLTLSIIDGLLVQAGDTRFIVPLLQIEECVELFDPGMLQGNSRHVYSFRDQLIPFIRLREFYDLAGTSSPREQMVIVRIKKEFLGLVVDHIIGDHQTVIKSLGWVYRKAPGLSGATILGDGQVALILDIAGVYHYAMTEDSRQA